MDMPPFINTVLLCLLNFLAGIGLLFFNGLKRDQEDIHEFIKSTRKKVDTHVEDFKMHGLVRPDK